MRQLITRDEEGEDQIFRNALSTVSPDLNYLALHFLFHVEEEHKECNMTITKLEEKPK